jgi:hypothetical protein
MMFNVYRFKTEDKEFIGIDGSGLLKNADHMVESQLLGSYKTRERARLALIAYITKESLEERPALSN